MPSYSKAARARFADSTGVDRPTPLAGPVAALPRAIREAANDAALGGMRSHHLAVSTLPQLGKVGTLALRALHASIEFNAALHIAQVLLQGGST